MKKQEILPLQKAGYNWKYCSIGGVTRISIDSAADIAHLPELDEKMWTVLSCPVKGLEFDERTLSLMDTNGDGRIHVQEVMDAAQWICRVLVDAEQLRNGSDELALADINIEDTDGKELREMAKHVLETLQKTGNTISIADIEAYRKMVEEGIRADFESRGPAAVELPYGKHTEALAAAVDALRDKINDHFLRCRLVRYDEGSAAVLDMSMERLGAISQNNLAACGDELATYPLARADKEAVLHLDGCINPVWQAAVDTLRQAMADSGIENAATLTESQWNTMRDQLAAYGKAKAEAEEQHQKELDETLTAELEVSRPIEKLLFLYRDFYRLLHNYVIMSDFYSPDYKAIFQAGKLYIDQRCCELCLRVADMSKHADNMASLSGMYLLYCTCTSKVKDATMDIVAVLTDGDVDDLRVGKNALFYDRDGHDWDATITKIVDNPISIRQAFWSPYRKFGNWVSEKINKSAAEKESKQFEEMTAKADSATADITNKPEGESEAKLNEKKAQVFDIAKFAGIFAAIGLALGAIGGVLVTVGGFVAAKWYNIILIILAIILIISGPSMLLAWLKLRKRNLGPVLNANGWAINSRIRVNVRFGATLTGLAQYPKMVLDDPYAKKKMPAWLKWLIGIVILAILFIGGFRLSQHRWVWQPKPVEEAVVEEQIEEAPAAAPAEATAAPADTATVAAAKTETPETEN